jgi:SAM-dependent methyltransferase
VETSEHEDVVRRSFDRQINLFAGPDSPFARRAPGALSWIEPLDAEMIVLDVACGAGHAAEQVAAVVRQVVGIDLTRSLLQLGRERLDANAVTNVSLQQGNAELLPFVDESFDVVFCRSSLHHFADAQRAAAEMMRVCKRGGRVVLLDLVPPDPTARDRFDHLHRLLDPSHVGVLLEAELVELVPGGIERVRYADTFTIRLPIDVAVTDQSDAVAVLDALRRELDGAGEPTGFEPALENDQIVVSFTMCVLHGERPTA